MQELWFCAQDNFFSVVLPGDLYVYIICLTTFQKMNRIIVMNSIL